MATNRNVVVQRKGKGRAVPPARRREDSIKDLIRRADEMATRFRAAIDNQKKIIDRLMKRQEAALATLDKPEQGYGEEWMDGWRACADAVRAELAPEPVNETEDDA